MRANDKSKSFTKVRDQFKKSKWITSGKFEYRISGKRYVTIVHNRKQVGSLVTLKTNPFIFRLQVDELALEEALNSLNEEAVDISELIKPVESESLTGFGDTIVDMNLLVELDKKITQRIFNRIFEFIIGASK